MFKISDWNSMTHKISKVAWHSPIKWHPFRCLNTYSIVTCLDNSQTLYCRRLASHNLNYNPDFRKLPNLHLFLTFSSELRSPQDLRGNTVLHWYAVLLRRRIKKCMFLSWTTWKEESTTCTHCAPSLNTRAWQCRYQQGIQITVVLQYSSDANLPDLRKKNENWCAF